MAEVFPGLHQVGEGLPFRIDRGGQFVTGERVDGRAHRGLGRVEGWDRAKLSRESLGELTRRLPQVGLAAPQGLGGLGRYRLIVPRGKRRHEVLPLAVHQLFERSRAAIARPAAPLGCRELVVDLVGTDVDEPQFGRGAAGLAEIVVFGIGVVREGISEGDRQIFQQQRRQRPQRLGRAIARAFPQRLQLAVIDLVLNADGVQPEIVRRFRDDGDLGGGGDNQFLPRRHQADVGFAVGLHPNAEGEGFQRHPVGGARRHAVRRIRPQVGQGTDQVVVHDRKGNGGGANCVGGVGRVRFGQRDQRGLERRAVQRELKVDLRAFEHPQLESGDRLGRAAGVGGGGNLGRGPFGLERLQHGDPAAGQLAGAGEHLDFEIVFQLLETGCQGPRQGDGGGCLRISSRCRFRGLLRRIRRQIGQIDAGPIEPLPYRPMADQTRAEGAAGDGDLEVGRGTQGDSLFAGQEVDVRVFGGPEQGAGGGGAVLGDEGQRKAPGEQGQSGPSQAQQRRPVVDRGFPVDPRGDVGGLLLQGRQQPG